VHPTLLSLAERRVSGFKGWVIVSLLRVILLLSVALLMPNLAWAEDLADLLKGLSSSDPKPAVEALKGLDDANAKAALQALANGALFRRLSDDAIVIGAKDGELYAITNAATGEIEDMASADKLEAITVSDEIKSTLEAAGVATVNANAAPLDFAGAVNSLKSDSFEDKARAIDRLSELADARAVAILEALAEGRLFTRKSDQTVVIGDRSGNDTRLTVATTATPAGVVAAAELDPIFINNNLRNVVEQAVGRLGLLSADAGVRSRAADMLIGNVSPEILGLLQSAIAKETDVGVRGVMALALASAEVADADKAKRLKAIGVLSGSADLRVRSLLQGRVSAETDPEVKSAAMSALNTMQRNLIMIGWAANFFQGISLGSILLLAAIGLAITFGVMGVINMAHGEMIMLGAYSAYVVQEVFRAFLPASAFDLYLLVAIPVGFLAAGAVGVALERGIIRFLYGRPLETMLATWGISLILQQLVRSIFGAPNKEVSNPAWMTGGFDVIGGFTITWNRLCIIVFCFLVLGALALVLRRTAFGLHMRAVTQNRDMASAMGIPTALVDALTFGLGSGIAGIAGVALSQIGNVSPNLGTIYIVDSFLVVVFGGVGNLAGTLVGAMTLGVVNKFLEPVAGAVLGKVFILVAIILFIQKRPRGLFALKGRAAEM
jgi:urea transport system permease protein